MSETVQDGKFVELTYKVTDRKSGHVLTMVEFPLGYIHGHNEILAPFVHKELEGKSVGDVIEVRLTVTAKNDYRYLVFEDMKGAGFEPLDLTSGHAYSGVLSYREFRDERVAFFCSRLPQGKHEIAYRLRAEIPGRFHIMPTQGHAMYLPDVRAISGEMIFGITEPGVR